MSDRTSPHGECPSRMKGSDILCAMCGSPFYAYPGQIGYRKFCSRACKGRAKTAAAQAFEASITFDDLWAMAMPEPNSGCLLWMRQIGDSGYGKFRGHQVHRFAYELVHGAIADGLEPDHLCRVKCCINPDHMEPVTHEENLRRAGILDRVGALNRAKTHCPQGHAYEGYNLFIHKNGARACRTCMRNSTRRRRAALKGKS